MNNKRVYETFKVRPAKEHPAAKWVAPMVCCSKFRLGGGARIVPFKDIKALMKGKKERVLLVCPTCGNFIEVRRHHIAPIVKNYVLGYGKKVGFEGEEAVDYGYDGYYLYKRGKFEKLTRREAIKRGPKHD